MASSSLLATGVVSVSFAAFEVFSDFEFSGSEVFGASYFLLSIVSPGALTLPSPFTFSPPVLDDFAGSTAVAAGVSGAGLVSSLALTFDSYLGSAAELAGSFFVPVTGAD